MHVAREGADGTIAPLGQVRDSEGRVFILGERTLVGRSRRCAIPLTAPRTSGEHCVLFWHRGAWWVRDLGSRNGTFVDGERLATGERRKVVVQRALRLGGLDRHDTVELRLVDASRPAPRAFGARGVRREGKGDLLVLPNGHAPEWTVFPRDGRWVVEHAGVISPLPDDGLLGAGPSAWTVEVPPLDEIGVETTVHEVTAATPLLACALRFAVSADEEHVELTVVGKGRTARLKPRVFHYLMLTLARRRLDDQRRGVVEPEQGWVYADELAQQLASSKPKVNLDICRARQQLAAAGYLGVGDIFERRATSNQVRLGTGNVEVIRTA